MKRFESQEANQLLGAPLNEIEGYTYCCDKHYRDMLERRRDLSAKPHTRSSVDTNVRPVRPPVEAIDQLQHLDQRVSTRRSTESMRAGKRNMSPTRQIHVLARGLTEPGT